MIHKKSRNQAPAGVSGLMIKPYQIWRCKSAYADQSGQVLESEEEFLVLVVTDPATIGEKKFVRVQPISRQTDYKTEEDILISDFSILGFPFIVETWNEQPVLTEVLEEPIGELPPPLQEISEQDDYSEEQLAFRKNEIRRTAFLRQSVLSVLSAGTGNQEGNSTSSIVSLKMVRGFSLAAVFIGVVLLVWQPFQLAPGTYFEKYATVYPNQLDIQYKHQETLRGEQVSVDGFNSGESELILLAMRNYDKNDFEAAVKIFEKVPGIEQKNSKVFYYYALSGLFAGKNEAAIQKLEVLQDKSEFVFDSEVLYYLALAYARNGNESKTRSLLESLKEKDPEYLNDKPDILDDLRWF